MLASTRRIATVHSALDADRLARSCRRRRESRHATRDQSARVFASARAYDALRVGRLEGVEIRRRRVAGPAPAGTGRAVAAPRTPNLTPARNGEDRQLAERV